MPPADKPDIDPVLADAVRRVYVRPVDEATARRHVSAMVTAASAGTDPAAHPARPPRRLWRPVLAAAAATLLAPVGLAAAGVKLPDAVEEPYRAVGIDLPRQERDAERAPAPAVRPIAPRKPSLPSAPTRARPTGTPRAPAGERPRRPRSSRPDHGTGSRPGNRTGQTRRPDEAQRPGRRPSVTPRPRRARPTGSARPNASAGPKQKRSRPKNPK